MFRSQLARENNPLIFYFIEMQLRSRSAISCRTLGADAISEIADIATSDCMTHCNIMPQWVK